MENNKPSEDELREMARIVCQCPNEYCFDDRGCDLDCWAARVAKSAWYGGYRFVRVKQLESEV